MTQVEDGIEAVVSGTVGRVFESRNGVGVVVEVQRPKAQYPDRITVWDVGPQAVKGDRVTFRGRLSWRKSEREGRTYVDVSLNAAELIAHEQVQGSSAESEAWSVGGEGFGDDSPF